MNKLIRLIAILITFLMLTLVESIFLGAILMIIWNKSVVFVSESINPLTYKTAVGLLFCFKMLKFSLYDGVVNLLGALSSTLLTTQKNSLTQRINDALNKEKEDEGI